MDDRQLRAAAFLDRDGTLIDELGYLGDPKGVVLYPGAALAVAKLNARGVPVVLVTNQSGIARGYFNEADLARVHARLEELLAAEGAKLDLILFAAYHPDFPDPRHADKADWRKPGAGMLTEAARQLSLDLKRSTMIGDTARDLEAGARAGLKHLALVNSGKGKSSFDAMPDAERERTRRFTDLGSAVDDFLSTL
ncbi:MAG: D-glycero-D-manno-heptose 1,7-bisphosphate phosphatase [Planctomycetota bacterium]